MKTIIRTLACATLVLMVACGKSGEKSTSPETEVADKAPQKELVEKEKVVEKPSIVGVWQMTDIDIGMKLPEATIKEVVSKTVYTFKEDGTLHIVNNRGEDNGTYTINDSTVTIKAKETLVMPIKELSEEKLLLSTKDKGLNMSMSFKRK